MFENVDGLTDDRRTMDAGVTGILIAHLGAFGSGEVIIAILRKLFLLNWAYNGYSMTHLLFCWFCHAGIHILHLPYKCIITICLVLFYLAFIILYNQNIGPVKQNLLAQNCYYILIYQFKHVFWVLKRTVSLRRFF